MSDSTILFSLAFIAAILGIVGGIIASNEDNANKLTKGKKESTREDICLNALSKTLEANNLTSHCSLNGYAEQAYCLEKSKDGWEVYSGERNNHFNSKTFTNILDASMELIHLLSFYSDKDTLKNQFIDNLISWR